MRADRRRVLRRIATHFFRYRGRLAAYVGTLLLAAFCGAALPLVTRAIIDRGVLAGDSGAVTRLSLVLLATGVAGAVASSLANYLASAISVAVIRDLRLALFEHLEDQPVAFFARSQAGALHSRVNSDVMGAQGLVQALFGSLVSNVVVFAVAVGAMVTISPVVAALTLASAPVFLVPVSRFGKRINTIARQQAEASSRLQGFMVERLNLSGALLAKLFAAPGADLAGFRDRADTMRAVVLHRNAVFNRAGVLLTGLGVAGLTVVYAVGGRQVVGGDLTVGGLIALAALVARAYDPLVHFATNGVDVYGGIVAFERVFEILDFPAAIADAPGARPLIGVRGDLEFDRVSFRHPAPAEATLPSLVFGDLAEDGAELVVDDVSFRVPAGTTTAIVGPTGAGKTTLTYLLARLYDVTSGAVRIDGVDVRDVDQASLRASIGMVTQDAFLLNDTLGNNLRYACPSATDADVRRACVMAHLDELVERLPAGLDTVMGDRGYRLSGGERQRVALARVFLKDPAVIVLDEATAHLDNSTEAAIQSALEDAFPGRTKIVVAHRLSTVRRADQIVVLARGTVTETGTHDELAGLGGVYTTLVGAAREGIA